MAAPDYRHRRRTVRVVSRNKKGCTLWFVAVSQPGGRAQLFPVDGLKDQATAEMVAERTRAKLVLGELKIDPPIKQTWTFGDYGRMWLKESIKGTRRATTLERYEGVFAKYLLPEFGRVPLVDIRRVNLKNYLLTLHRKGRSRSTIAICRDVLSGIFNAAVDDEIIERNPIIGVLKSLKLERKTSEIVVLTADQIAALLQVCRERRPEYFGFFLAACRTGARLGELLALKWDDVDLDQGTIRICRSAKRGVISATKTGRVRVIDLSGQLLAELEILEQERPFFGKKVKQQSAFIFPHRTTGKPIAQNTIRNIFKKLLTGANLPKVKFHSLRHSCASILLQSGCDMYYVSHQLGHQNINMTYDVYSHFIPASGRKPVSNLDDPPGVGENRKSK